MEVEYAEAAAKCRLCLRGDLDEKAYDLRKPEPEEFLLQLRRAVPHSDVSSHLLLLQSPALSSPHTLSTPHLQFDDVLNWPHRICQKCRWQVKNIFNYQELVVRNQRLLHVKFGEGIRYHAVEEFEDPVELETEAGPEETSTVAEPQMIVVAGEEEVVEEEFVECDSNQELSEYDVIGMMVAEDSDGHLRDIEEEPCEDEEDEHTQVEIVEVFDSDAAGGGDGRAAPSEPQPPLNQMIAANQGPLSAIRAKTADTEIDELIASHLDISCPFCFVGGFANFSAMTAHTRAEHASVGYVKCCGMKFTRRQRLFQHVRYHKNPAAFRCDECKKTFHTAYSLDLHREEHLPDDQKRFVCEPCGKRFFRQSRLRLHTTRVHLPAHLRPFACEQCDKSFHSASLRAEHVRRMHEEVRLFVCETCAKCFKTKQNMKQHQLIHADNPKVRCEICRKVYSNENQLRRHKLRHHQDGERVFECGQCDHTASNHVALRSHIKYKHDTAPDQFQCADCGKGFKRASTLREHVASTHTGEKLYKCKFCEMRCNSSANMYKHQKARHPEEYEQMRQEREQKMYSS